METDSLLKEYIEDELFNKSKGTIETYIRSIKSFLKWVEDSGLVVEDIKKHKDGLSKIDLQEYVRYLQHNKNKQPVTVKKDWAGVVSFLKWKEMKELTQKIQLPTEEASTNFSPKSLSDEKINKIRREEYRKSERTGNWRDSAIIIFLSQFGLRVEELQTLNLSSVELTERKGSLRILGKGNKERILLFPKTEKIPYVRETVSNYLTQRIKMKTEEEALFLSNRGSRMGKRTIQCVVEKHNVHCHAFRHSYITKLVRQGKDISLIMSLTGHSSPEMIMRYSKPNQEDKENAMGDVNFGTE